MIDNYTRRQNFGFWWIFISTAQLHRSKFATHFKFVSTVNQYSSSISSLLKMVKVTQITTRSLRSSRRKIEESTIHEVITKVDAANTETPAKASKRRKTVTKSLTSTKYTFRQLEQDLLEKYPIPPEVPIKLPESYITSHQPEFIKGIEYILSKDPSLYPLIIQKGFEQFHPDSKPSSSTQDHFQKVCRSIIGQQISGASAVSVERKFSNLYDGEFPTPEQVKATSSEDLRNSGLSVRKAEYIKSAADFFLKEKVLDFENLTNEEIIDKLMTIKGIGEWSAQIFLAFSLKRLDVFAPGDLGIARGISRYVESRPKVLEKYKGVVELRKSKFDDKKKRDWKVINDGYVDLISDEFKPYRTVLMLVLWRASATNIEVLS